MKFKIVARAAVVTSGLKTADIKAVAKYNSNALFLKDENKQDIFAITAGKSASITGNGICFNDTDADGMAQMTLAIPEAISNDKRQSYIVDTFAAAFASAEKLEPQILEAAVAAAELGAKLQAATTVIG